MHRKDGLEKMGEFGYDNRRSLGGWFCIKRSLVIRSWVRQQRKLGLTKNEEWFVSKSNLA
jgi:hypothetical protein